MLTVNGLNRSFDERQVLHDVTFGVAPGRLTGFVGANGAGKTTVMRIILGVLAADSGTVTLDGRPLSRADRQSFGYMPEERGLYPKMKLREQLVYLGRLHRMPVADARASVDRLLARLDLTERAGDVLDTLSLGNQQRAQIAAALAHNPTTLVLDEPFSGLDPIAVDVITGLLRERAAAGVPVLFSSHQLDVMERLCDDLVIIRDGRVVAAGERDELRRSYAEPRFEIVVDSDAGWLRDVPGVKLVDLDGPRAIADLTEPADDQSVLRAALDRGPVRVFRPVVPTLAEIFREVTR
jgi:ABC-2 type transport system ATP-binding protein